VFVILAEFLAQSNHESGSDNQDLNRPCPCWKRNRHEVPIESGIIASVFAYLQTLDRWAEGLAEVAAIIVPAPAGAFDTGAGR
jgi:hypothetical protein